MALPQDQAGNIRYFANPGPDFEERCTPDDPATGTMARAIAFYLPQFHAFAENDTWWGTGFTEWRNVSRGTPRFQGHYQPRIPRDLGFYDLNSVEVIRAQAALARAAGINGFCFYYYWFNGKRLMDKPLDLFASADIDQDFCIMWANENWTRRWDGRDQDVLIAQEYRDQDEDDFIADTSRYMAHPRYIRLRGRPLFILYRPSLLPDPAQCIERWRRKWTELLGTTPLVFMAQTYAEFDPAPFACDGAIEFPPHKVSRDLKRQNRRFRIFDKDYSGQIRSYEDVVAKSLGETAPAFPLIKTVSPHWDNDARREGRGVTFQGSTPGHYARWLSGAIEFAQAHPVNDEALVFINAWNEWAEAAYLEPDVHYGHAYLNATWRSLTGAGENPQTGSTLLLVGHDAHPNGAQMLLLALTRTFIREFGLSVRILLKRGGALLPDYQALAATTVLEDLPADEQAHWFDRCGCRSGIFNTCVTGDLLEPARRAGLECVSLVHEMPSLIREYGLQSHTSQIASLAQQVVFPSVIVETGFRSFEAAICGTVTIQPQGLYKNIVPVVGARLRIRRELGVGEHTRLILNAGYADHRKGFDLFVLAALRLCPAHPDLHFCWVGKRPREMSRWLKAAVAGRLKGRLHLVDFCADIEPWYSAADCFYLASREDPFPSVVLEALCVGLPIVVHRHATGFADSLLGFTTQASADDVDEIDAALLRAVYDDTQVERALRQGHVQAHYRLDDYASLLLALSGIDEPQQDTPKPGTSVQAEAPDPDTLLTATDRTATDLTATG